MQAMHNEKGRWVFLLILGLFLVAGLIFLGIQDKGALVLLFNRNYNPAANFFFKWTTHIGDGAMIVVLLVAMLFVRYYYAAIVGFMGILQLFLVQALKKWVFGPVPRPPKYFQEEAVLSFVPGVDVNYLFAFPSGHTTTAFSISFILTLLLRPSPRVASLLFLLALTVGVSRIYLTHHFLEDVLAGAVLGVINAWLAYLAGEYFRAKNPNAAFFHGSLLAART